MMKTNLLVGTSEGLFALVEDGEWSVAAQYLKDIEISQIDRDGLSGNILIATRGNGLTRLDPESGILTRLGEGQIPDKVRCVTVSPTDADRIYIGTEPIGVFMSADQGQSWTECEEVARMGERLKWGYPVPNVPPHIRDILIDRSNPERLFAAVQVGAVIISEDGGGSWRSADGKLDADVHCLVQDPRDTRVLYASAGGGGALTMQTLDQYPPPLPQGRPLYRSADSGESWECISLDFERTYGVAIRVDPGDSETLLAAVGRGIPPFWAGRPEQADAVVIVSRDEGQTWSQKTEGLPGHFTAMVEAIEIGRDSRSYIATGGEGMKRLQEDFKAEVFISDHPDGAWRRLPIDFPAVSSLLAV
jgi:hypothetical protein